MNNTVSQPTLFLGLFGFLRQYIFAVQVVLVDHVHSIHSIAIYTLAAPRTRRFKSLVIATVFRKSIGRIRCIVSSLWFHGLVACRGHFEYCLPGMGGRVVVEWRGSVLFFLLYQKNDGSISIDIHDKGDDNNAVEKYGFCTRGILINHQRQPISSASHYRPSRSAHKTVTNP